MRIAMLALCLFTVSAAHALEVAGVQVPEQSQLGASTLVLNGAGLRTRVIFKVYVGALYLPEKKSSAAEVLALKGPKRVSMTLLRELSAEQLVDALDEGVRRNHGEAEVAEIGRAHV